MFYLTMANSIGAFSRICFQLMLLAYPTLIQKMFGK